MSVKRYLRSFANHTAYNEYINGSYVILPNVSYCKNENEVHYNPSRDYSKEYLTFEARTAGTVTVHYNEIDGSATTVSYSIDGGDTWTSITTTDSEQSLGTLAVGDKVLVKGSNDSYYFTCIFGGTAQTDVYGNILSMIYGDNFENQTTLPVVSGEGSFEGMFWGYTNLVSAENLILPSVVTGSCYNTAFSGCTSLTTAPALPATTLATYCYNSMFYGCTSLTTAPVLPAATLVSECYMNMFYGCSSLNYVKMLATDISEFTDGSSMLYGVSATGTFVKNSSASWTESYFVPTGWTVETASA